MSGSHYIFFEDSSVTDFPLKEVAPEGTPPASFACARFHEDVLRVRSDDDRLVSGITRRIRVWIGRTASADSTESMLQRAHLLRICL
jgi:hypothetical protein